VNAAIVRIPPTPGQFLRLCEQFSELAAVAAADGYEWPDSLDAWAELLEAWRATA
jgi:hypothetical protein